jgi:hypothetical protein
MGKEKSLYLNGKKKFFQSVEKNPQTVVVIGNG